MKKLLLVLATASLPALSYAQGAAFGMNQNGGGFYVAPLIYFSNYQAQYGKLGLDQVDGNSLPLRSSSVAYPKLSNSLVGVTIGGFGCRSSILFGGEISAYYGASSTSSMTDTSQAATSPDRNYTLKSSVLGGDVLATIGIVAVRTSGLVVTPVVGLGYGGMGIFLSDSRDNRQYPIYTTGNQENKYIYNTGFTFDVGLGVDYYFGSSESKAKGFRLGVKVGYRNQLGGVWNASGGGIASNIGQLPIPAPDKVGSSGLYLKLVLGIGSIGNK